MKKRLIIFDVDGTLVSCKSGEPFRTSADDWCWLPNRIERCKTLHEQGTLIAIASNQAGVAFPWSKFTEAEMQREIEKTGEEIGACFVAVCYTTPNIKALPQYHNPSDQRRKPGPGMLLEAMAHCSVLPTDALFVGDRPEEQQAAAAAGVAFQWAKDFFGE